MVLQGTFQFTYIGTVYFQCCLWSPLGPWCPLCPTTISFSLLWFPWGPLRHLAVISQTEIIAVNIGNPWIYESHLCYVVQDRIILRRFVSLCRWYKVMMSTTLLNHSTQIFCYLSEGGNRGVRVDCHTFFTFYLNTRTIQHNHY